MIQPPFLVSNYSCNFTDTDDRGQSSELNGIRKNVQITDEQDAGGHLLKLADVKSTFELPSKYPLDRSVMNRRARDIKSPQNILSSLQQLNRQVFTSDSSFLMGRLLFDEARQGSPQAQFKLGEMYNLGQCVKKDTDSAFLYYEVAANNGHIEAQFKLGNMYASTDDNDNAIDWYRKAAEQELAIAQIELARCYFHGLGVHENYPEALFWIYKAVGQGDVKAQYVLGDLLWFGKFGVKQNPTEALKYYHLSAEYGYVNAQCWLVSIYESGSMGVNPDVNEAIKWSQKLHENNCGRLYPTIYESLGNLYKGLNDYTSALDWYRIGHELGVSWATYNLGLMYEEGQGVEQNHQKALELYREIPDVLEAQRKVLALDETVQHFAHNNSIGLDSSGKKVDKRVTEHVEGACCGGYSYLLSGESKDSEASGRLENCWSATGTASDYEHRPPSYNPDFVGCPSAPDFSTDLADSFTDDRGKNPSASGRSKFSKTSFLDRFRKSIRKITRKPGGPKIYQEAPPSYSDVVAEDSYGRRNNSG